MKKPRNLTLAVIVAAAFILFLLSFSFLDPDLQQGASIMFTESLRFLDRSIEGCIEIFQPGVHEECNDRIQVDYGDQKGISQLKHGANEAVSIGLSSINPKVDQMRDAMGFDTMRIWFFRPWWKVGNSPTTLPSNFHDDPDLKTIDEMLRIARSSGAELQFVIAHAPDHLLPEGASPLTPDKNKAGIHKDRYPEFRQYVLDLVEYIIFRSPEALNDDHIVIEIWNEPESDTFDNLGMEYADVINDIGLTLIGQYPNLIVAANPTPYFEGLPIIGETEWFYRSLDPRLMGRFRAAYHLYNSYQTAPGMASYFENSYRLFQDGPRRLRSYLKTLGDGKGEIPLYISEHNLHTQLEYRYEMAGREGAAMLAVNVINMVKSGEVEGHHFYEFISPSLDHGFGLVGAQGMPFANYAVFGALQESVPTGATVYLSSSTEDIKVLATKVRDVPYVILVNIRNRNVMDQDLGIFGLDPDGEEDHRKGWNLLEEREESLQTLRFDPYEVKVLRLIS